LLHAKIAKILSAKREANGASAQPDNPGTLGAGGERRKFVTE
jgi:hypothetical protein